MELNRSLYFVIPVVAADGSTMHVHIAPISLQVFEEFAGVLAETMSDIHTHKLGPMWGPRVAAMLLKEVAQRTGAWDKVQRGLVAEMERLTHVVAMGAAGWEVLPYAEAIRAERIDEDNVSQVANAMVFFMLAWRLYPTNVRMMMVDQSAGLWGGSTSLLNCTAYAASLPTSTETESSGVKTVPVSSAPS